ncbi:MAG: transcription termination factor NusA [Firmicutes bacterium]|nr:transcription termination factor NusA [Bacillota bacterium]
MNEELLIALELLEKEKGISKDTLIETIEAALITAYKKNFGSSQNVRVIIDDKSGEVKVYSKREVVEESFNELFEVELEDAKEVDPNYELGDFIEEEVTPKDFGRIAAQTAKQVVVQRIREAERSVIFDEFINRESEIVTGLVQRISKGIVYVNLGKVEAMLLPTEQIPGEVYNQGDRIKTYIIEVKKSSKGPQVLVSRTHPGLVRRLFELEVPEIHDGIVEVKGISREAGSRTKIAVYSPDETIDPVGSCVGQKGVRVQSIVDELKGEKIDIIKWSEDPAEFISNSLSPSSVDLVVDNAEEKSALVVVPDYQLSLAIGKEGQNARLAAKLTNWKIDIKSDSQYRDEVLAKDNEAEEVVEEEIITSEEE